MTNGLSESKVKWVTYLVYFLLVVGMAIVSRQQYQIEKLQDSKVSKERYLCDNQKLEKSIEKLDNRFEKLLERLDRLTNSSIRGN